MLHIVNARYLGGFRVHLEFNDGFTGIADLAGKLNGPVFQSLNDPQEFSRFEIEGHTLTWSTGADLAPEYLHELAKAAGQSLVGITSGQPD